VLAQFGSGQVLISMFYFFLFFIWIMLLFQVFGDLFRDKETSGLAKFVWIAGVIFFPYIGVFVYLVVRGSGMADRQMAAAKESQQAFDSYVKQTAGSASPADELTKLQELKAAGTIDDAEFASMKAKIIG
jgi:hypothetical protein